MISQSTTICLSQICIGIYSPLRLCVILSSSEGVSAELIAQAHRISVDSVYRYLREYENETKTKHDQRGGSESKLDAKQTQKLLDYLHECFSFNKRRYLYGKALRLIVFILLPSQ
jgi:transposase